MRIDKTAQKEQAVVQVPSWDNSTLRHRLDEQRPAPGVAVHDLQLLVIAREAEADAAGGSRRRRRRRR